MLHIREYRPEDAARVEQCYIELQDNERRLETLRAEGEAVVHQYLEYILARCVETHGAVFVAELDGLVVGFVCVWAHVVAEELINIEREFALITDLVVLSDDRGRGIGRALLERAEQFAVTQGAKRLRIGVLAKNVAARRLYERFGFADFEVNMLKTLSGD